nr:monocopper oxidase-like protein SKS1 [Tanacetum cinerariifolium]
MEQYKGTTFGELSPHLFAAADDSCRFVNQSEWQRVTGFVVLQYSNSKGKAYGPLPHPPSDGNDNSYAVNQAIYIRIGAQEEYTAGGPTNAKPARSPRSGPMVAARFSTVQAPASNDRELPNTASKNGGPVGPTNRKRTLRASSSSPPVTQWANGRPQKISRTAKEPILSRLFLVIMIFHIWIPVLKMTATILNTCFPFSVCSKPARPHTRRPSDRKANSRQEPTIVGMA